MCAFVRVRLHESMSAWRAPSFSVFFVKVVFTLSPAALPPQSTFPELGDLLVVELPEPSGVPVAVYVRVYLAVDPLPSDPAPPRVLTGVLSAMKEFDG